MTPGSTPDGNPQPSSFKNLLGKILILGMYMLNGFKKGWMCLAVPLLLRDNGATFADLSFFSLCRYPFAFFIFYGFIIDMFYLKRYGKTLTYVNALGYLFSIWMFIVSVVIEE